jgi:hypothetical protein
MTRHGIVNQIEQRHVDSFGRGQHYLDDQASDVAVLKDCDGRKQLDDALERIAASSNEQGAAIRQMDGLVSRQRSLVPELRYRYMQPIATFARARLQGVPDFAALTRSTLKLRPKPLVHAARAMAVAAAPHAEALAKGGFPDCIARLTAPSRTSRTRGSPRCGRPGISASTCCADGRRSPCCTRW